MTRGPEARGASAGIAPWTLVLVLVLPAFWKNVHMDDAAFLRVARQMRSVPGDPYGFHWDYLGEATSALVGMPHPPLQPGALAVLLDGFGEDSPALRCIGLAALAILAAAYLRFGAPAGGRRLSFVVATSPIVAVMATSLLSDLPALAWTALAVVSFPSRSSERGLGRALLSGVALALAVATRYACLAFALLPWLANGRSTRDHLQRVLATLPAALLFLALQLATQQRYGTSHVAAILAHVRAEDAREPLLRVFAFLPTVAVLAPWAVLALPRSPRRRWVWIGAGTLGAFVMPWGLELSAQRHGIPYDAGHRILAVALAAIGAAWLVGAVEAALAPERRGERRHLLGTLFVGMLAAWATPKGEARYALPLAIGFAAAFGPRLRAVSRPAFAAAAGLQVLLAGAMVLADVRASRIYASASAQSIPAHAAATGHPTFLRGELGFRHAFERRGFEYLSADDDRPRPGDRLARSEMATPAGARFTPRVRASLSAQPVETWTFEDGFPLRLHQPHAGAGFYGHGAGLLPFAVSRVPHDRVHLFAFEEIGTFLDLARATAESADARFPLQTYLQVAPMRPTLEEPERRSLCLVGRTTIRYPVRIEAERPHLRGVVAEPARLVLEGIRGGGSHVWIEVRTGESDAEPLRWSRTIRSRERITERCWFPFELDLGGLAGREVLVELGVEPPAEDPPSAVAFAIFADLRLE